jgi:DNA mismatch repair protein MutL
LALTHFDIRFVLEHNDQIRLNLPIADSGELRFQRVQQLLGQQFTENAYWIDAESINMRLSGWLDILLMHEHRLICNMFM